MKYIRTVNAFTQHCTALHSKITPFRIEYQTRHMGSSTIMSSEVQKTLKKLNTGP